MAWLAATTFRIQAHEVEVEVHMTVSLGKSRYAPMCDCLKPLAGYIEKMATKKG
jgi:hypothetical protein